MTDDHPRERGDDPSRDTPPADEPAPNGRASASPDSSGGEDGGPAAESRTGGDPAAGTGSGTGTGAGAGAGANGPEGASDAATPGPIPDPPAGDPTSERQPADDTEADFDPDTAWRLRDERAAGVRNFTGGSNPLINSNSGAAATGDRSFVMGGDNYGTIHIGAEGRAGPRSWRISQVGIQELRSIFVEASGPDGASTKALLVTALRERAVAVVVGRPGSGRVSLAVRALTDVVAKDEIVAFDPGTDPFVLASTDFAPGRGHVLDVTQAARRRDVMAIADRVAGYADGAPVVLIADVSREGVAGFPTVRHVFPDRPTVLHVLLERRHRVSAEWLAQLPDSVYDAVRDASMSQVATVAAAVATAVRDGREPDAYLRGPVTDLVRRQLEEPTPGLGAGDVETADTDADAETVRLFHRALLISVAVFNGMSLRTVTDAAVRLGEILRDDEPGVPPLASPFTESTGNLLEWLEADAVAPSTGALSEPAAGRTVRLRNPMVPGVLLEVVWTDHHLVCTPVLRWLNELARVHQAGGINVAWPVEVQLRAAQALGRVARYDFRRIVDDILEQYWVKRNTVTGRRAAAWAVEVMAADPDIAPLIWDRVREWGTRGATWRRAALLVYANTIDIRRMPDAFNLVARVVGNPAHADSYAVAAVVRTAALAGALDDALVMLADWLRQIEDARWRASRLRFTDTMRAFSGLPGHAARCLVLLGEGGRTGTRSALLDVARNGGPERRATIESLWYLALTEPSVSRRGWDLLESWLRDADSDEELEKACRTLLEFFRRDRRMHQRLVFHGKRWRREWAGRYPISEQLLGGV
ncbi:MAG: hypothetical protein ACQSGP_14615 [Frankia sp.]